MSLRRYRYVAIALIAFLVGAGTLQADVPIKPEHYVPNKKGGYCAWCSLKTVLLHNGLHDLAARVIQDEEAQGFTYQRRYHPQHGWIKKKVGPGGATTSKMKKRLDGYIAAGYPFRYKMQSKNTRLDLIRDAVAKKLGCVVSFHNGTHAVTIVDLTTTKEAWRRTDGTEFQDYTVRYIDSNDVIKGRRTPREMALSWFKEREWDGWVVVIYPQRRTVNNKQMRPPMRPSRRPPVRVKDNKPPSRVAATQETPAAPPLVAQPTTPLPIEPRPVQQPGRPLPPPEVVPRISVPVIIAPSLPLPRSRLHKPTP